MPSSKKAFDSYEEARRSAAKFSKVRGISEEDAFMMIRDLNRRELNCLYSNGLCKKED